MYRGPANKKKLNMRRPLRLGARRRKPGDFDFTKAKPSQNEKRECHVWSVA